MIVTIDTDRLEDGDLAQVREVLKLAQAIIDNGIQLSLLGESAGSTTRQGFDRSEKMPDKSRRWLSIKEAADVVQWTEAYLYKHFRKRGLGRRVNGRVYIDKVKLLSIQ